MRKRLKKIAALSVLLSLALMASAFSADDNSRHHHPAPSSGDKASDANPLIEEMIKLDAVYHEIVSGVSLGDGARVHKAIESMHGAMEKTHEGVHEGTVQLQKNARRLAEFVKMDKNFHHDLETLAHAARKNDRKAMLSLTKKLLDGCVSCHRTFRK